MYSPLTSTVSQFSKQTPLDRLVTPMVARPPRPFCRPSTSTKRSVAPLETLLTSVNSGVQTTKFRERMMPTMLSRSPTACMMPARQLMPVRRAAVPLLDGQVLAENPGEYGPTILPGDVAA